MITRIIQNTRTLLQDKHFGEVLSGSMFALGGKVLAAGFGLALNFYVASVYGPDSLGLLAIVMSTMTIAAMLAVAGNDMAILKLVPAQIERVSYRSARYLFGRIVLTVFVHAGIVSIILYVGADFLAQGIYAKSYLAPYFKLTAIGVIAFSLQKLCREALRPLKWIKSYALFQFLFHVVQLLIVFLLSQYFFSADNPVYSYLFAAVIFGLVTPLVVYKAFAGRVSGTDPVEKSSNRKIYALALPMMITISMSVVIGNADVLMLGAMRTDSEVGIYQITLKLGMLVSFILNAINTMSAPKFSELYHSDQEDQLKLLAMRSSKLIFWVTAPVLIVLIVFGKLVLGMFGQVYVVGYGALVLLSIGQFINSMSGSVGYFLSMTGGHLAFRNIIAGAALANIVLNALLIPVWGILGSAAATMVALAFWNIISVLYIRRKHGFWIWYFPGIELIRR